MDLFGEIVHGEMVLNEAGKMVEKWYYQLESKFPDVKCHQMVVMPNHFHCVLENAASVTAASSVGADPRVCPHHPGGEHIGSPQRADTPQRERDGNTNLFRIVQWFKTMTTNEYIRGVKSLGWKPFNGKLWQRNYYESIIRSERSYLRVCTYIRNNPAKWQKDPLRKK
jgi:putative transposase